MITPLHVNEKAFITVQSAAEVFGYSRDHITRLAKGKKIIALQVKRRWFVQEDSLKNYFEIQKMEALARQADLREQRQRELSLHSALTAARVTGTKFSLHSNLVAISLSGILFAVSVYIGFDLLEEPVVVASVVTSIPAETASQSDTVIHPVFSSEDSVLVNQARSMSRPDVTPNWILINHD